MGRSVSVEPGAPCTDRDRAERCGMSMSPVMHGASLFAAV